MQPHVAAPMALSGHSLRIAIHRSARPAFDLQATGLRGDQSCRANPAIPFARRGLDVLSALARCTKSCGYWSGTKGNDRSTRRLGFSCLSGITNRQNLTVKLTVAVCRKPGILRLAEHTGKNPTVFCHPVSPTTFFRHFFAEAYSGLPPSLRSRRALPAISGRAPAEFHSVALHRFDRPCELARAD